MLSACLFNVHVCKCAHKVAAIEANLTANLAAKCKGYNSGHDGTNVHTQHQVILGSILATFKTNENFYIFTADNVCLHYIKLIDRHIKVKNQLFLFTFGCFETECTVDNKRSMNNLQILNSAASPCPGSSYFKLSRPVPLSLSSKNYANFHHLIF